MVAPLLDFAAFALVGVLFVGIRGTRTWRTLAAWLATGAVLVGSNLVPLLAVRVLLTVAFCIFWAGALGWPRPLGLTILNAREEACEAALRRLSIEARAAVASGGDWAPRLGDIVTQLEALDVPDTTWRAVRDALVLDLLARPPAVGRGVTQTPRLAWWPWRAAVDRRVVAARLTDHLAGLSRPLSPDADTRPPTERYDEFLRVLMGRFAALLPPMLGGPHDRGWALPPQADRLVQLAQDAPLPDRRWAPTRAALLTLMESELRLAPGPIDPDQAGRLEAEKEALKREWEVVATYPVYPEDTASS